MPTRREVLESVVELLNEHSDVLEAQHIEGSDNLIAVEAIDGTGYVLEIRDGDEEA